MAKRRRKKAGGEAPTSDCVLLCDDVLISQGTGKHSLLGVIGGITVAGFPAVLGGYMAYARFSNVYAGQKITLKLISASTEESLLETEISFPAQSEPLGVYTVVTKVPHFIAREPGRYLFGAYHDGIPVATSPIVIVGPPREEES
jgi:hypothetical protein